jgi:hypothetical protein
MEFKKGKKLFTYNKHNKLYFDLFKLELKLVINGNI